MFNKKRKLSKYRFNYSKSPSRISRIKKQSTYSSTRFKPRKSLFSGLKRSAIIVISLSLSLFLLYIIFVSNYFLLKNVTIKNKDIADEMLGGKIKDSFKKELGSNLIFIDTSALQTEIQKKFPELEKLKLSKNYPNQIEVSFAEYPLVANIINESSKVKKTYIVNSVGFAMKENYENPALPFIKVKSEEPVNIKKPIIEVGKLRYILEAVIYFQDKFGMKVIEIEYKPIARELHLITEKNFAIWLDMQKSSDEQLKKLKKALVKLDIYNESLLYIDLRIAGNNGDKIIFKRK